MTDRATGAATLFSQALCNVSSKLSENQRIARQLLSTPDPFDRVVPSKVLAEAVAGFLVEASVPAHPLTVFMDRLGGGDGVRAGAALIGLVGESWPRGNFVHVAFATPSRGVGALARANLTRSGADAGVVVDVVAHNRPVEGLSLSPEDVERLVGEADLVITYAPGGIAGLIDVDGASGADRLLVRSHVAVCSLPDPEALVADLASMGEVVGREPGLDALRFRVEVESEGVFAELGDTVLGEGGDANQRLWVLLDNAKRQRYRIVIEPMCDGLPTGMAILCPCQTILEGGLLPALLVGRVVKAGSRLVAVGRGRETLS
ncbi:MAG: hypothetical protein JRF63_02470 [Deltaproteobacteria bacterium]|nr:hypothetical protein [Deltaproteobacteria bacterium]